MIKADVIFLYAIIYVISSHASGYLLFLKKTVPDSDKEGISVACIHIRFREYCLYLYVKVGIGTNFVL